MPRTGLLIGKFMPPHDGHRHLIDTARKEVDRLTVVVCSIAAEPIPGPLRHAWMRELYPDLNVLHLAEELPQEPADHPEFWALWTAALRRVHPDPVDAVFASEPYVHRLAACLGASAVEVDTARRTVPISASAIRANPLANWRYIPEVVRPYFVRRVCVLGTESTGKSTLARDLAARYDTAWAPEYARAYIERHTSLDALTLADIERIATGHLEQAERLARHANRVLFLDTDLLTTTLYSQIYFGSCPDWIIRASRAERHHIYLLTAPDVPWVDDPQRNLAQQRDTLHARFRGELQTRDLSYVEVRGDWQARLSVAIEAVDALLRASIPPART